MLACYYNENCIDENRKKTYLTELEIEIEKINHNLQWLEQRIEEISNAKKVYFDFEYDSTFFLSKTENLNEITNNKKTIKQKVANIEIEIKNTKAETLNLYNEIEDLNNELISNNKNKVLFSDFIEKNDAYISNKSKDKIVEKSINENHAKKRKLEKQNNDITLEKENNQITISEMRQELNKAKEKLSKLDLSVVEKGFFLNLNLEQLENEYYETFNEKKQNIYLLEKEIKENNDYATKELKELKRLSISEEEYSSSKIIYSEDKYEAALKIEEEKSKNLSESENKKIQLEKEKAVVEQQLNDRNKNLIKLGYNIPMERSEVRSNFEQRRETLEKEKAEAEKR